MRSGYLTVLILFLSCKFIFANNPLPLDSVLHQAMNAAESYSGLVSDYESEVYMRAYVKTNKKNFLYKYTYLIPGFVLHDRKNDEGLIESISKLRMASSNIYFQDVNYINGTMTRRSDIAMLPFRFMSLNIYKESAPDESYLLPLRKTSAGYYQYKLISVETADHKPEYTIEYTPRYKNSKLISGTFVLEDSTWRVKHFTGKGSDLFFNFSFEITMGQDLINSYLPVKFAIRQAYTYFGNKVVNRYNAILTYKNVKLKEQTETRKNLNLGNRYKVRMDSVPANVDSTFWNKIRPLPLSENEQLLLSKYAEKRKKTQTEQQKEDTTGIKSATALKFAKNMVLDSKYRYKSTSIRYSGVFNPSMISYSSEDGLTYRQKLFLGIELARHQRINIDAFAGYVFNKKEFYGDLSAVWNYDPAKFGNLSFSIGKGNQSYSSLFLNMVKDSLTSQGLNIEDLGVNYFKDFYVRVFNSVEITNGLQLGAGFDYHIREPNKSQMSVSAPNHEQMDGIFDTRYYFVPVISLSWTPEQYYTMDKNQKVYVRSEYPTFKIQYAHSLKNVFGSTSQYSRVEFDINQNIRFDLMKSLQYHVGTGFFSRQKTEYFTDFVFFRRSYFPETWGEGIGGVFNVLPRNLYNASSSYIQAHLMYETPRFLLTRIQALSGGVVKERLYYSQLFTPTIPSYSELGYGVGNRFLNAALFVSFFKLSYQNIGFKSVFLL
ncbi:MAG TPA: DUF5686 family protein [Paludibacteraceae bacterium]|nr:DUF5686 family protein [Paludibacteraceae bacterium]